MTAVENRHARRSRRIEQAIERAALEYAIEQGFDETTVAEIADRADVAPRTVYGRFATKEAIVLTGLAATADAFIGRLRDGSGPTVERLATALVPDQGLGDDPRDLYLLRMRAVVADPYLAMLMRQQLERVEDALSDVVASETGVPADHVGVRACAAAAIGVLLHMQRRFIDRPADDDTLRAEAADGLVVVRAAIDGVSRLRERAGAPAAERTNRPASTEGDRS
jgi:AcrR family transcriptional regulator